MLEAKAENGKVTVGFSVSVSDEVLDMMRDTMGEEMGENATIADFVRTSSALVASEILTDLSGIVTGIYNALKEKKSETFAAKLSAEAFKAGILSHPELLFGAEEIEKAKDWRDANADFDK